MARKSSGRDLVAEIKQAANGRWAEILSAVCGFPAEILDGQPHPCPKAGCGGRDRFRFTDHGGGGSLICNQCARRTCGDGLASIQWFTGWTFPEVVRRVADHLGLAPDGQQSQAGQRSPPTNGKAQPGSGKPAPSPRPAVDPGKDLQALPWSDSLAGLFCLAKPPITTASIKLAGGRLARYRGRYTVVDLPIWGETADGAPVGHVLYNASGGTLPMFSKGPDGRLVTSQVKIKLTLGSKPGLIGTVDRLAAASTVWKVEGPSDALAILSLVDLPPDVAVISNAMGAGEKPAPWMLQRLAGKQVYVIGDSDAPGQAGAELWGTAAAYLAESVRLVRLPYAMTENHGRDVRDWLRGIAV